MNCMKENYGKITLRVDLELLNLVNHVAETRRESVSDLVRRSLMLELARHSYLDDATKKAMGIPYETQEIRR